MASGTLYTYPNNFRAYKALIAAKYSGSNVSVAEDFKFGETNKDEKFLAKFPLGKVPAFESSSGANIYESNAIAYYVSNDQLTGTNRIDSSYIQQWINFSENEILPSACSWVYPCLGIIQFNKQDTEKAKTQLKTALTVLDQHLLTRTYLVGERITLADIIVMCNLLLPYEHVFEPEYRASFTNVNRWFTTMINQSQVKSIIPSFTICSKAGKFDPAKYAEVHGIQKKDKKPAQPKKEAPSPKKNETKEVDEEEEEDIAAMEAKQTKDPFADMPKGTFNMDEFKRTYCNNEADVSLPYLWEHFDSENYSFWYSEYLDTDGLGQIFQTCNLVAGMFQRLDKLNKNAFAMVYVCGDDKKNSISGLWLWKGTELVFTLSKNWNVDYESYTWKKLDTKKPEDRDLVEQYLIGEVKGKVINKVKVFK